MDEQNVVIAAGPEAGGPAEREKTWGMICHIAALPLLIIPFASIIGPLVVWRMKRSASGFVDHSGREAVNFQISMTMYALVAVALPFVVADFLMPAFKAARGCALGAMFIGELVLIIDAAIKTKAGARYTYPITIHFISQGEPGCS